MNAAEYDALAARTMRPGADPVVFASFGIAGESGELVDRIKKHLFHGKPVSRNEVLDEVGDVLWYLTTLCRQFDANLEDAMTYNIDKLCKRYPNKYSDADSLARVDYASSSITSRPEDHRRLPNGE